jgi:hypothetical protein
MFRALVVVESMFGNTRDVADAVAGGLSLFCEVEVVDVASAPAAPAVDLLVVGGPTHALGMSRAGTRAEAVRRGAPAGQSSVRRGLREYVDGLRHASYPVLVATFDTRVHKRGVPGSAARSAARRLVRSGARTVLPPETFWVEDLSGPLLTGELARARVWGERLGSMLRVASP